MTKRFLMLSLAAMTAVTLMLLAGRVRTAIGEPAQPTPASKSHLADAMLAAVRTPDANQFPTPESVVRFLFEQVRNQDIDEATKAFPIAEYYDRTHFSSSAKYIGSVDFRMVLPQSPYHNAIVAFQRLDFFDRISLGLLPVGDMGSVQSVGEMTDAQLADFEKKFDRSALTQLTISSLKVLHTSVPAAENLPKRDVGAEQVAAGQVTVKCGEITTTFDFETCKIKDNWRVDYIMPK